ATTALRAVRLPSRPSFAGEAPGRLPVIECGALGFILDCLERGKHVVPQRLEPHSRTLLAGFERCRIGGEVPGLSRFRLRHVHGATSRVSLQVPSMEGEVKS